MTDETIQIIARKLAVVRQELEALGIESSVSWRSPGGDQPPIAQLLAGDLAGINQVKKLGVAPGEAPAPESTAARAESSCVV